MKRRPGEPNESRDTGRDHPAQLEVTVGPVPDVLQGGPVAAHRSERTRSTAVLRRAGLPVALAVLVGTAIADAGHRTSAGSAPETRLGQPTRPALLPRARPLLVIPQQAHPGERLTVLAHRDHRFCGAAQLRFDGGNVPNRVISDLGSIDSDWVTLIMTIDLPLSLTRGRHVIRLDGPKPGGRGPICAEAPEHQGRIAEAALTIR